MWLANPCGMTHVGNPISSDQDFFDDIDVVNLGKNTCFQISSNLCLIFVFLFTTFFCGTIYQLKFWFQTKTRRVFILFPKKVPKINVEFVSSKIKDSYLLVLECRNFIPKSRWVCDNLFGWWQEFTSAHQNESQRRPSTSLTQLFNNSLACNVKSLKIEAREWISLLDLPAK